MRSKIIRRQSLNRTGNGESTVIDDPDAMGDAVSDDDSDGVSVPMDEDLVPVQGDTEDAE